MADMYSHQVRVWDARTGQELLVLKGHTGSVWAVSFSDDGKHIASWSSDVTVRVWDAVTGHEAIPPLRGHVTSWGDISPNIRMLAERVKDAPASAPERVVVGRHVVTSVEDHVVIYTTTAVAAQQHSTGSVLENRIHTESAAVGHKMHSSGTLSLGDAHAHYVCVAGSASDIRHSGSASMSLSGACCNKSEVIAQFGAPAKVTSVCCMSSMICAGCEDGQVCYSMLRTAQN
jgi:hypothetical protein